MMEITAEIRALIDKAAAGVELAGDEYIDVIRQIKFCLIPQIKNNFLRHAEALRSVLFAAISAYCFM